MSAGGAQVPGTGMVGHVKVPPSFPRPSMPPSLSPPLPLAPPVPAPPTLPPLPLAPPVPARPPLPPSLVPPVDPEPPPLPPRLVVPPDPSGEEPQPTKRRRAIDTGSRRFKRAPCLHVIVGASAGCLGKGWDVTRLGPGRPHVTV